MPVEMLTVCQLRDGPATVTSSFFLHSDNRYDRNYADNAITLDLERSVPTVFVTGGKAMEDAAAYVPSGQIIDLFNGRTGHQEMEDVLSRRLPSFYRTAYRFLGNAADAEDAVQEALLSAHKHLHEFRGQAQMSTWLTVIVRNCARMQLRKRPRQLHVSLDEPIGEEQEYSILDRLADNRANPEDQCQEGELKARLRELAAQLSPALRRSFQLHELQGLSIHETATILEVSEGTVKAQLSRARAKLTRSMRRLVPQRTAIAGKTS
jgi:RNA polymerase sigma-70 factor (ECF subfamily)